MEITKISEILKQLVGYQYLNKDAQRDDEDALRKWAFEIIDELVENDMEKYFKVAQDGSDEYPWVVPVDENIEKLKNQIQ